MQPKKQTLTQPKPQSATQQEIEAYNEKVRRGEIQCKLPACPHCRAAEPKFKRHDARPRIFFVILDQIVNSVLCLLSRWKCMACGRTFTLYPDFALPYKRYTLPTIMDYVERYITVPQITYRALVNLTPVGHQSGQLFDHSTIHRWISTLGGYVETIRGAWHLVQQAKPELSITRCLADVCVSTHKYRSEKRKNQLEQAWRLQILEALCRKFLVGSTFPNLATRFAYG